jgi:hypothetical protein
MDAAARGEGEDDDDGARLTVTLMGRGRTPADPQGEVGLGPPGDREGEETDPEVGEGELDDKGRGVRARPKPNSSARSPLASLG